MILSRFTLPPTRLERVEKLVNESTTTSSTIQGAKSITLINAPTVPATNPTSGGILYAQAGSLRWRSQAGTITTIGNA